MSDKPPPQIDEQTIGSVLDGIRGAAEMQREEPLPNDGRAAAERTDLEIAKLQIEIDDLKAKSSREEALHNLRTKYVPKLYGIIRNWIFFVGVVVIANAIQWPGFNQPKCDVDCWRLYLSDNVLITLISSTTATVVGLFYVVAKWLYPSSDPKDDKDKKP